MSVDDDIRAALDSFARQAPHPERVRSTLQARIRRHRQRRLLLTVGTVAAGAAAVGVPAYILLRPIHELPVGNLPTPLPEPSPGGTNLHAPMLVRPTWLPEGLTEISREGRTGEVFQLRMWASKEYVDAMLAGDMDRLGKAAIVALRINARPVEPVDTSSYPPESPPPTGPFLPLGLEPNTTVGPHPAHLSGVTDGVVEAAGVQLKWQLDDGRLAEVEMSKMPDAVNIAMRIALSVVPDTTAGVEVGFSFGWLPAPILATPARLKVYGMNGNWVQSVEVYGPEYGPSVRASLRRQAELGGRAEDSREVTVRGRAGQVVAGEVVVQLDSGHWLGVVAPDEESSIRVANEIVIGPEAYRGWIGTR